MEKTEQESLHNRHGKSDNDQDIQKTASLKGPQATTLQASNDKGVSKSSMDLGEKPIILSNYTDYLIYENEAKEKGHLNLYTVSSKEMPTWYVDNDYIFRGYRRITNSYWGCVKSLFYLHNETGNIYSHGLGVFGFLGACIPLFIEISSKATNKTVDSITMASFFVGITVCLGLSTAFHLCCCHSRKVSLLWNKLDYLGIVFLIIGSFVPVIWYGFQCNPNLQKLYISMITIFGLATICISLSTRFSSPQYRYLRTGLFTAMGLSGIAPLIHTMVLYGFSLSQYAFASDRIMIMGFLYVLGAIIYASRVPERWFPGRFDIWGHSHQIFHILVLCGAAVHYSGILLIYNWWKENNPHCAIPTKDMMAVWATKQSLV